MGREPPKQVARSSSLEPLDLNGLPRSQTKGSTVEEKMGGLNESG